MATFENKFVSVRQDWPTPEKLYREANKRYNFDFDLAADASNTKCPRFFSEHDDALSQEWEGSCWLNPPYGGSAKARLALWVRKAYEQAQKDSCSVAMLIPTRTNTRWWHQYCMRAKEILFVEGRPKFGDAKHGLPQPLAIVFFDGDYESVTVGSIQS